MRWFGTKVELFVLVAAVPEVDGASMAEFTGWAMDYVKSLRNGLPGARNATMILPALAGGSVQPSARNWAVTRRRRVPFPFRPRHLVASARSAHLMCDVVLLTHWGSVSCMVRLARCGLR
ncbi:hypothetical protein [Streptomyces mirabilis]|uniref:hypothetical protein n=1 Tax=Streptomyces mirabilis TaxID=68239 RepID=UPI0036E5682F